jgi:hypothetical protein
MHSPTPDTAPGPNRAARPAGAHHAWARVALVAPACFILGLAAAGSRPVAADPQSTPTDSTFLKFGENYININHISHVVDKPGFNLPPGSLQVYFGGGSQSWVALFGEEAEAFRHAIEPMTTDHTPKGAAPAAGASAKKGAAPASKKGPASPKKTAVAGGGDPGGF